MNTSPANPPDVPPAPEPEEKRPLWRPVTENLECLAIAIVMALMLKFFLIEAYKIPTGSMQPTIIGNEERGLFDRVLVNKFIYLMSEPKRWDVIVFKYPLDQSKNYIKRLIGLPGEKVTIMGGDIFINDKIERKPEEAARSVLKKIYPVIEDREAFLRYFKAEGNPDILDGGRVVYSGPGSARTKQTIRAKYLDGYDPDYGISEPNIHVEDSHTVGDLRIAFTVRLHEKQGGIRTEIEEGGKRHVYFLSGESYPGGSYMETSAAAGEKAWSGPDIILEAGKDHEVVFSHIDDCLSIHLDGKEIAAYGYDSAGIGTNARANAVEFAAVGCGADFEDIAVYRDIYYLSGRDGSVPVDFQVPSGHYFALGDNTQNSADSRLWRSSVLTLEDGSTVEGSADQINQTGYLAYADPRRGNKGDLLFTDIYGDRMVLPRSEIQKWPPPRMDRNFIPEKLMLGKAMVVFWPIYPYFRWKLLR